MIDKLPQVHYGRPKLKSSHRSAVTLPDPGPDDDAELPETPPDVIAMLGFDPKELS